MKEALTTSPHLFHFESRGIRLAGERWGGGDVDRPALVLLHGGGQTRHSWERTARWIGSTGRTAVALDARGHGDSEWAADRDYTLDAFAADLVAFVSTLERPPVLVGASLGGITSLAALDGDPGLASGLVLVDVVVEVEPVGVEHILGFMTEHPDGFGSLEEVADAVGAYNPQRKRPANLDGLRKNVRQGEDGRWRWHWDPAYIELDGERRTRLDPAHLGPAAERIEIPTLLVRGLKSDVVSDAGLADMRRRIPQAQVAEVGGAGHMVAGDDNDVFAAALDGFLDGIG